MLLVERPDRPEWDFLVGLSRRLDLERLALLAMRHGMLPHVAECLIRHGRLAALPGHARRLFTDALLVNRYRAGVLSAEARRTVDALRAAGVRVACNKGIVLQQSLYGGRGVRTFADIDLMVDTADATATAGVLRDLGFRAASWYDPDNGRLAGNPRSQVLLYRLYPDHLPHHCRLLDDPVVPYVDVDVAFSMTWHGARWQVSMSEVLDRLHDVRVRHGELTVSLPVLSPAFALLFLVLHLFREAWFERSIAEKPLRLPQFGDIARAWQRLPATGAADVRDLVARHGLGAPVGWVAHHVDAVFGAGLVEGLAVREYGHPLWLRSAAGPGGRYLSWEGDMAQRLRRPDPVRLTPFDVDPADAPSWLPWPPS
jgi:hypothetical protein